MILYKLVHATMMQIKSLDCPNEYLVSVCGFYGSPKGTAGFEIIRSLTSYTNKAKYGPLGKEIGKFFCSPLRNGMIVGMLGKSGVFGCHWPAF